MVFNTLTKEIVLREYWELFGLKEPPKESENEDNGSEDVITEE